MEFPSSLTSTERAFIHRFAQSLGYISKSRGYVTKNLICNEKRIPGLHPVACIHRLQPFDSQLYTIIVTLLYNWTIEYQHVMLTTAFNCVFQEGVKPVPYNKEKGWLWSCSIHYDLQSQPVLQTSDSEPSSEVSYDKQRNHRPFASYGKGNVCCYGSRWWVFVLSVTLITWLLTVFIDSINTNPG